LLFLAACAPQRGASYDRALAEAVRAETHGRFREAAERYDAAAKEAKVPRDGAHARYLAATMVLRAGDLAEARTRFDTIATAEPTTADSAIAAYHAAEMRIAAGDADGWSRLEAFLHHFPDSGVARPGLHHLLRHEDELHGPAHTIERIRELQRSLGGTELGEALAYQIALRLTLLGQPQAARDAFVDVATRWPYPSGALFDDALFRASELDEKLGKYTDAIADLERMLEEREDTTLVGSYQRPRYGAAILRIATLYRDRLHDKERARDAFHRLYADFKTSPWRDDALWQEAELWREDGDTGTACARLATLADDFPDSRYIPCAMARCPRVKRSDKSRAPKTCHGYIERPRPEP
jgi:TolA-binding protein